MKAISCTDQGDARSLALTPIHLPAFPIFRYRIAMAPNAPALAGLLFRPELFIASTFLAFLLSPPETSHADHIPADLAPLSTTDGFDLSHGVQIITFSPLADGSDAIDAFGGRNSTAAGEFGHVVFKDYLPGESAPSTDFIEFTTRGQLLLKGARIVVAREGALPSRAFQEVVLRADLAGTGVFDTELGRTAVVYTRSDGFAEATLSFAATTAQCFRIEFVRPEIAAQRLPTGGRVVEVDAITERPVTLPSVQFMLPSNHSSHDDLDFLRVEGSAQDPDEIQTLTLLDGERVVRQVDSPVLEWDWPPPPPGTHVLRLQAVDSLGWTTVSDPVTVEVKGGPFRLLPLSSNAVVQWRNGSTNAILGIFQSEDLFTWSGAAGFFSMEPGGLWRANLEGRQRFFRGRLLQLPPTREGFENLTVSYGDLLTLAGSGGQTGAGVNKWLSEFEGGAATDAQLSRPHIALSDDAGNVYIADKDAHGIRKVTLDGRIFTVAGTSQAGNGPDDPQLATQVALTEPNGLWVAPDGTFYILDLGNEKIRKVTPDGICRTVCHVPGLVVGRGLWVAADGSRLFVASGDRVKKWTRQEGVSDFATGFNELGNLVSDPSGTLVVTDRGANRVYRLSADGQLKSAMAGNGGTTGGGDGQSALSTGLEEVRGIWFLPTGGFFLATDDGSQEWYVDPGGTIHLWLNGSRSSGSHGGDGTWFYAPSEQRVSRVKAVTFDRHGNMLVTENNAGYVRKIRFLPK